jgi:hypothetical protein
MSVVTTNISEGGGVVEVPAKVVAFPAGAATQIIQKTAEAEILDGKGALKAALQKTEETTTIKTHKESKTAKHSRNWNEEAWRRSFSYIDGLAVITAIIALFYSVEYAIAFAIICGVAILGLRYSKGNQNSKNEAPKAGEQSDGKSKSK